MTLMALFDLTVADSFKNFFQLTAHCGLFKFLYLVTEIFSAVCVKPVAEKTNWKLGKKDMDRQIIFGHNPNIICLLQPELP